MCMRLQRIYAKNMELLPYFKFKYYTTGIMRIFMRFFSDFIVFNYQYFATDGSTISTKEIAKSREFLIHKSFDLYIDLYHLHETLNIFEKS